MKLHSGHMEIAVVNLLNYRQYTIIPNVSYGWNLRHEADLLAVTKDNFVTEIEIKISVSDLKADFKKVHNHRSNRIHRLVYAVPDFMLKQTMELVPKQHGIIAVKWVVFNDSVGRYVAEWVRRVTKNGNPAITEKNLNDLLRLGAMRIWSLKQHNYGKQLKLIK